LRLKDKVAVVTGAASGFGEGMVRRFAEEGAKVVVADLNAKGAERVAKKIGAAAVSVQTDVSQASEIEEMVDTAMRNFGRVDIMVNNAGYTHRNGDLTGVDEETFEVDPEGEQATLFAFFDEPEGRGDVFYSFRLRVME
jgi:3-oxoacyl-[acyl-carrier protein] reductase